jgi:2-polyprenyl-3-methyl-5-hydroxy-6-metoxy-1,4-benzoquinol methylase
MPTCCTICGATATAMIARSDVALYRCRACTHCFSDPNIAAQEHYEPEYFDRDHRRWFAHPDTAFFTAVAGLLPRGGAVIDVGCGRGDFLRHVRTIRPDLKLTGIDLAPNRPAEGIQFLQGNLLTAQLGAQFDAIVSQQVIEHIDNLHAYMGSLRRLAKPGATVVVSTINESSLLYGLARMGKQVGVPLAFDRLYGRHHCQHFTTRSLRTLLETQGFHVESQRTHNAPLEAIDIPVGHPVADAILRSGMWLVCRAGSATGTAYLQTVVSTNAGEAGAILP